MTIKTIVIISIVTAVLTTFALIPVLARSATPQFITKTVYVPQPTLSPAQTIWLARLMLCESGIKATAVNPNDLDNTPSYGLLQFKPGTFNAAAKQFGIASTSNYMNPNAQVEIVTHWILEGGIDWHWQFPDCTSKLGIPPTK